MMKYVTVIMGILLLLPLAARGIDVQEKGGDMAGGTLTADSLLRQADEAFGRNELDQARAIYEEALTASREQFVQSVQVEALAQLARVSRRKDKIDEGRRWLGEARAAATESEPFGWTRFLGVKGRFEWKAGDLAEAAKTFNTMYLYANTNGLFERAVDAARMMAIVSEDPAEQIEWSRRGIEVAEAGSVEKDLGSLWNNLAITYSDLKEYDSSLTCFLKAREYHWRFSGEVAKLYADYHVGMTYRKLGEYENASTWLRPVLAWAERLENHSAIGQACEDLGEIALATGKRSEGASLLNRARDEYQKAGFDKSWPEIWDNINKRLAEIQR
jgi:tetratricopeptide (TPR) repeat protein